MLVPDIWRDVAITLRAGAHSTRTKCVADTPFALLARTYETLGDRSHNLSWGTFNARNGGRDGWVGH
jgi:hypothetical protein